MGAYTQTGSKGLLFCNRIFFLSSARVLGSSLSFPDSLASSLSDPASSSLSSPSSSPSSSASSASLSGAPNGLAGLSLLGTSPGLANEDSRGPDVPLLPKALPKGLEKTDVVLPPLRANGEAPDKEPPNVSLGAVDGVPALAPPKPPKPPDEADDPPNTLGFEPAMAKADCVVASLAKPELANAACDVTGGLSPLVPLGAPNVSFASDVLSILDRDELPDSYAYVSQPVCFTLQGTWLTSASRERRLVESPSRWRFFSGSDASVLV